MPSQGLFTIRYRRRYYVFNNPRDSYPAGLCKASIETIPQDPLEYEVFLTAKRALLAAWEERLESAILSLAEESLHLLRRTFQENEEKGIPIELELPEKYDQLFDDRLASMPCFVPPSPNEESIEWSYTIDLDHEVLTVDAGAHLWLRNLPRGSLLNMVVGTDGINRDFVGLDVLPDDMIADLVNWLNSPTERLEGDEPELDVRVVRAEGLNGLSQCVHSSARLLGSLWESLQASLNECMGLILLSLKPEDFFFREIAFAIVSMANGLSGTLTFVDTQRVARQPAPGWAAIFPRDSQETIVASDLAAGYHKQGVQTGSAPLETTYWYEDVVVHLAMFLENDAVVTNEIRKASEFGQRGLSSKGHLTVLLMSIEHIVIA